MGSDIINVYAPSYTFNMCLLLTVTINEMQRFHFIVPFMFEVYITFDRCKCAVGPSPTHTCFISILDCIPDMNQSSGMVYTACHSSLGLTVQAITTSHFSATNISCHADSGQHVGHMIRPPWQIHVPTWWALYIHGHDKSRLFIVSAPNYLRSL